VTSERIPTRCAHCGRKIYYFAGDDSWAEGWCHVKSNLRHCDYTHNLAEPVALERDALVAAVREELVNLWSDLEDAVRMAANGSWSGGCERLKDRIKALSDLVGPARWQDISIPFLLSETYRQVCEDIGHPCQATAEKLAEVRDSWTAQHPLPRFGLGGLTGL
jgi:hypothetical protein